ncbi:hypothetical protein JW796_04220 [Candidatus Dojkabacteria bacterium]|nr:hypothetical protein [Candidatus Dojkabacteria bacterium]
MTERQKILLAAVIKEYMKSAKAVGSLGLREDYELKVSPATIRNEMVELMDQGFLKKDHVSSGRIPTTLAWRFFIEEMLEEIDDLDPREEVAVRERIFQSRFNTEALIREAVKALSDFTGHASFAIANSAIYSAGIANILDEPEFQNLDKIKRFFHVLENYPILYQVLDSKIRRESKFRVLIGEEIGLESLDDFSIIFGEVKLHGGEKGYIAALGPSRMNYAKTFKSLESIIRHLKESIYGW